MPDVLPTVIDHMVKNGNGGKVRVNKASGRSHQLGAYWIGWVNQAFAIGNIKWLGRKFRSNSPNSALERVDTNRFLPT